MLFVSSPRLFSRSKIDQILLFREYHRGRRNSVHCRKRFERSSSFWEINEDFFSDQQFSGTYVMLLCECEKTVP